MRGAFIPEDALLLLLFVMAIGILLAYYNMQDALRVQYRKGCNECREHRNTELRRAEEKAKAEAEAEKRRQEQHDAEMAKLFPPPQDGKKPPKNGGGWAV